MVDVEVESAKHPVLAQALARANAASCRSSWSSSIA
jgi:hypothetical protein